MVAYNFQPRFAPLVESGKKTQTIRALRKCKHAQAGNRLQLYTGMRTKGCRKLIEQDPVCVGHSSIEMTINESGLTVLVEGSWGLPLDELILLAKLDGFGHDGGDPLDEFIRFFESRMPFKGVIIYW